MKEGHEIPKLVYHIASHLVARSSSQHRQNQQCLLSPSQASPSGHGKTGTAVDPT